MTTRYIVKITALSQDIINQENELPLILELGEELNLDYDNFKIITDLYESYSKKYNSLICLDISVHEPNTIIDGYIIYKNGMVHSFYS